MTTDRPAEEILPGDMVLLLAPQPRRVVRIDANYEHDPDTRQLEGVDEEGKAVRLYRRRREQLLVIE